MMSPPNLKYTAVKLLKSYCSTTAIFHLFILSDKENVYLFLFVNPEMSIYCEMQVGDLV